jgi:hypothetical protein
MSASEAKTALDNFFTNTEAKVLFLKGKWGSGKSYFVRDYLKHNSQAPEYQFFVSLFGLTSLKEVRESINANLSIRSRNAEGVKNAIKKISKLADKTKEITEAFGAKAVGAVAAWVASAGDSLFWQYAHSKECVIVFDDLERTKLPIEDILGLASSLSENTKAKIIIIFNEDELDAGDNATLTKYREKVADNEVLFNPSLEEMVANHLRHKALREVVQQIFGRLQITNIRLLRKIDINIETFAALIKPHKITPTDEENLRMAKLVCVKYLSPKPIPVLLVSSGFFGLSLNKQKTEEDAKLHELVRQLDMFPAYPLDELMFECIENGYCSAESIQKQIAAHQTNKQRDEFTRASSQWHAATSSIQPQTKLSRRPNCTPISRHYWEDCVITTPWTTKSAVNATPTSGWQGTRYCQRFGVRLSLSKISCWKNAIWPFLRRLPPGFPGCSRRSTISAPLERKGTSDAPFSQSVAEPVPSCCCRGKDQANDPREHRLA